MKIAKQRLKEIIKEEVQRIIEGKKGGFTGPPITEPVFEEEEELDEMSAMSTGAVTISPKKEPLEEEDGFYEPHI